MAQRPLRRRRLSYYNYPERPQNNSRDGITHGDQCSAEYNNAAAHGYTEPGDQSSRERSCRDRTNNHRTSARDERPWTEFTFDVLYDKYKKPLNKILPSFDPRPLIKNAHLITGEDTIEALVTVNNFVPVGNALHFATSAPETSNHLRSGPVAAYWRQTGGQQGNQQKAKHKK
ncbi:hypothetical protein DL95DRAFT_471298 [Leptodontidium sp. 2 PMI_412]|nr:hypothetical protein DL95DRAFT_471298 [Leptodontidium sp. 2 PMI_412]